MKNIKNTLQSSVGKKQVVALTGLMLILFVAGHLVGNLFIYLGPDAFNAYAKKLANLRPGLYLIEAGLLAVFLVHMWFTMALVHENYRSRPVGYNVKKSTEQRSFATRIMPYTGTIILAFVIWHLLDFTFVDKHGGIGVMSDGIDYGVYGMVVNAFSNPIHSIFYIIAMFAVGSHLSHGIQSFVQTFGLSSQKGFPTVRKISDVIAVVIALGFSSIPLYVLFIL